MDGTGELLEVLGHHSIAAAELKAILHLIPREGSGRSGMVLIVLRLLRGMAMERRGPSGFFSLDGYSAALRAEIPWATWASPKGWGFSAWIRAESFTTMNNAALVEPTLFHASAADGTQIRVFFRGGSMHISTRRKDEADIVQMGAVNIPEQEWHQVTITHVQGRLLSSARIHCFVDGSLVQSEKLSYAYPPPNASGSGADQASTLCIGACVPCNRDASSALGGYFFGQLGPVYFFNAEVSELQATALYASGADGLALQCVSVRRAPPTAEVAQLIESSGIEAALALSFNPHHYDDAKRRFLNCAPGPNPSPLAVTVTLAS